MVAFQLHGSNGCGIADFDAHSVLLNHSSGPALIPRAIRLQVYSGFIAWERYLGHQPLP